MITKDYRIEIEKGHYPNDHLVLYVSKEHWFLFLLKDMKECKRYASIWSSTHMTVDELRTLYNNNYLLEHIL